MINGKIYLINILCEGELFVMTFPSEREADAQFQEEKRCALQDFSKEEIKTAIKYEEIQEEDGFFHMSRDIRHDGELQIIQEERYVGMNEIDYEDLPEDLAVSLKKFMVAKQL